MTGPGPCTHRPRSIRRGSLPGQHRLSSSPFWEERCVVWTGVVRLKLLLLMERIAPNRPLLQPRIPMGTEQLPRVEMDS